LFNHVTGKYIAFAQALLRKQFPSINGLKSTFVAQQYGKVLPSNELQILLVKFRVTLSKQTHTLSFLSESETLGSPTAIVDVAVAPSSAG